MIFFSLKKTKNETRTTKVIVKHSKVALWYKKKKEKKTKICGVSILIQNNEKINIDLFLSMIFLLFVVGV